MRLASSSPFFSLTHTSATREAKERICKARNEGKKQHERKKEGRSEERGSRMEGRMDGWMEGREEMKEIHVNGTDLLQVKHK